MNMYTTNEKLPRLRAQAVRMLQSGKSTREVARYFGYSQSAVAKWSKRYFRDVPSGIQTRSSRPHTSPRRTSKEIEGVIIGVRKETKRCAEVVYEVLKLRGIKISLSTVKRVLSRYGCLKKRSPWKKRRMYPIRPGIEKQGDLVEFDTVHFVGKDGKRSYIYTAIDVFSRYAFASASTQASCARSITFLRNVRKYFPFDIKCIQTDNGSEFGRWFTNHCKTLHRHNHPRSPNENGHLERLNRTLQEEPQRFMLSIHKPRSLERYLKHYNTERLHMGINFKTPAQMLKK